MLALVVLVSAPRVDSADPTEGMIPTKWSVTLPADTCHGGGHTSCHYGSPVLADINGDSFLDVVAVTNKGYVVAIRHDGSILWQTDVAPSFGMASGTHEIFSSPAIADIDADGQVEVVVGTGTIWHDVCTQGGVIALSHNGSVESGWPKLAFDGPVPPAGCADSIISSPSLGDLDNDGDMEVVVGGFDKRLYAWHHDGSLLPGFPLSSYHRDRFPTWPTLIGRLADDMWSSPALADLDGDGYLDIASGTGEGNFDARWGGNANGWECPYRAGPGGTDGYCGGAIYAVDRFGQLLPGFPRYFLESVVSSLAMADVNDDGAYEMFVGFSDHYYLTSPDHPTYGFRLVGLDHLGNDLPGWSGGKPMGGVSMMSPAIGDIAGDSGLEVVTLGTDRKLYAWHTNGTPVAGFPMTPRDMWGGTPVTFASFTGLILADYDGDPKMEIMFNQAWSLTIVDGNGQQLTNSNYPHASEPLYYGDGMLVNTPAVGDIDKDGKLELVATNSVARAWDLDNATNGAHWPMFRYDAQHQGKIPGTPVIDVAPDQLLLFRDHQDPNTVHGALRIQNKNSGTFNWTATAPANVSLSPASGMLGRGEAQTVHVSVTASGLDEGYHSLGDVEFFGQLIGIPSEPGYTSVPVSLYVGEFTRTYISVLSR